MKLSDHALGSVVHRPDTVQRWYDNIRNMDKDSLRKVLCAMCLSHERLRADEQGLIVLRRHDLELLSDAHDAMKHTGMFHDLCDRIWKVVEADANASFIPAPTSNLAS